MMTVRECGNIGKKFLVEKSGGNTAFMKEEVYRIVAHAKRVGILSKQAERVLKEHLDKEGVVFVIEFVNKRPKGFLSSCKPK